MGPGRRGGRGPGEAEGWSQPDDIGGHLWTVSQKLMGKSWESFSWGATRPDLHGRTFWYIVWDGWEVVRRGERDPIEKTVKMLQARL